MSQLALSLRDVAYDYGGRRVLQHVTLYVPKARISVVMGANGSGKTTLLRIAAGLARPRAGAAETGDGVPTHLAMSQGRIGYIPQQLGLVKSASVMSNALMGGLRASGPLSLLGYQPADVRERALRALDLVGLREKAERPAKSLSGGERQRVAIARTLVQKPDVIVADELIASLDALSAHAIMEIARELRREGVALLMALHHIDVALANADQVMFLVRGGLSNPRRPEDMSPQEARSALTADAAAPNPPGVWGRSP